MAVKEDAANSRFEVPQNIWFPDFEKQLENLERCSLKYPDKMSALLVIHRYFSGELTRNQFVTAFLAETPPKAVLSGHRKLHRRARELCGDYQSGRISAGELDEELFLSLRNRHSEDVFAPDRGQWEEIMALMSGLERKTNALPVHFFGMGWSAHLAGRLTRKEFAETHLTADTWGHLMQFLAYGIGREEFAETYKTEISVCQRLNKLSAEYKDDRLSPGSFDAQFLALAKEFCGDILK